MDKTPDGCLMVFELFREGECFADQMGNSLTKRVVEALNIAGFAGFRRAISHRATHDLAGVFILGQPDPDLLHLGAHK